jgi:hypothetical protein
MKMIKEELLLNDYGDKTFKKLTETFDNAIQLVEMFKIKRILESSGIHLEKGTVMYEDRKEASGSLIQESVVSPVSESSESEETIFEQYYDSRPKLSPPNLAHEYIFEDEVFDLENKIFSESQESIVNLKDLLNESITDPLEQAVTLVNRISYVDQKTRMYYERAEDIPILENMIKLEDYFRYIREVVCLGESTKYDPPLPYDKLPEELKKDPVHAWRAKTGIELIHLEPSREELIRIWKNWCLMSEEQKAISDKKSIELFGVDRVCL